MDIRHILEQNLRSLRMPGILENMDTRINQAKENDLGYLEFLSLLIQDERSQRNNNQISKLLRQAFSGIEKTFEGFDFNFNRQAISERVMRDLATCGFIDMGKNIVIAGPPGIGKTHIAKSLGHEACRRKKHVMYNNIYNLLSRLLKARSEHEYERILNKIVKVDLLILDDFALRKFDVKEVDLLYSITDSRQDYRSIILTSNRPPEDWLNAFPDPVIGGAILDRLISGAIKLITKNAKSYRKEGKPQKIIKN